MSNDIILRLGVLLLGLLIVGTLLCLPLYKGDFKKLIASSLFIKIVWWIPIWGVLALILYNGAATALSVAVLVALLASKEFIKNKAFKKPVAIGYIVFFLLCWSSLGFWFFALPQGYALLAAVATVSVLSDVCAFFLGNYASKHSLPSFINRNKSWEGVVGQILGAALGGLLSWWVLQVPLSIGLVLVIGIASAVGDIINSIAKRSLGIKDWGRTIPGHGGVLDRFSSLSVALAASLFLLTL